MIASSQLRKVIRRVGPRFLAAVGSESATIVPSCKVISLRNFAAGSRSNERIDSLQAAGVLDGVGLTKFDTLHELQLSSCAVFDSRLIFGTYFKEGDGGSFKWMTYQEFSYLVDKTRAVLRDIGIVEYSKVGIISNNRWEWAAVATAAYSLNATVVPMYEAQLPDDWTYILNDSACSAVFCATEAIFHTLHKEVLPSTPSVKASLCFDSALGEPQAFATVLENVGTTKTSVIKPTPEDLADLIYTSGTTGKPKGVELTHDNIVSNVKAGVRTMVEDPQNFIHESDRTLAFLPWAHSYGQTCELWGCMSQGASIGIGRGVPLILEDLQHVKPTILFSVPTLYKRIYDGVHNMMESSSPIRKGLMKRALDMGRRKADAAAGLRGQLGPLETLQFKVLDRIILDKIRARFGGNLKHAFVAGAACPAEVLDFMDDLGIAVCEGYGLTETSPIIAINTPENRRNGYVGRPIGGVQVLIINEEGKEVADGEEGEICCVGPNVMRRYHNNPEATAEVITTAPDGVSRMFRTGDLGRMDNGYLKVTGRLKEQYKLENGKYVVPTPIEEAIGMSRFISQVVLYGANRPHNVALLVPDLSAIRTELKLNNPNEVSDDDLVNDKRVKALIDAEIVANCWRLKKYEVPTRWAFVAPFTAANNMLTPKMSIRRHKVIQTYMDVINMIYGDEEAEIERERAMDKAISV